jgi:glycosyltransferase involved in cell wall biosynthesis
MNDTVVLFAGRLDHQKGVDFCIRALPRAKSDVVLVVAGEGPERERLSELASGLRLAERLRLLGLVEHAEIDTLMQVADVFVLPSRNGVREGLPMGVLEALSNGLPIVAAADVVWPTDIALSVIGVDPEVPESLGAAFDAAAVSSPTLLPSRYLLEEGAKRYCQSFRELSRLDSV